jgi:GrpB-like predicted nucleotidyltransferase (UPF0157 family)
VSSQIQIMNYDPRWPEVFRREVDRIRTLLGCRALQIEHAGSTSVPGLAAKPIIDILLVEPNWHEHRMFKGSAPDINLHVFSSGCPEINRILSFRDRLRSNGTDRDLYERAKRDLAEKEWADVQDYADAKTAVITGILARTALKSGFVG